MHQTIFWNEHAVVHTVSADDRSFDTSGTYDYHCAYHPTMRGTIEVLG